MRHEREGSYEQHRTITDARGIDDPVYAIYRSSRPKIPHRLTPVSGRHEGVDRDPAVLG